MAQGSCLAGLTHLGAAFLVLLGFALVLLAYKVVSTHVTTSELGWGRATYQARALRALGLLLADGAPTVGGGKTF